MPSNKIDLPAAIFLGVIAVVAVLDVVLSGRWMLVIMVAIAIPLGLGVGAALRLRRRRPDRS